MTRILPYVPPEQMTNRARAYLLATVIYCFSIAATCYFLADHLTSNSFAQIRSMLPLGLTGWSIAYLSVGVASFIAAFRGSEKWAWVALIGATAVVGPWAAGFWIAFLQSPDGAPTGVITYTWATVVHMIQARQPLRSPFDPVLRTLPPTHDEV